MFRQHIRIIQTFLLCQMLQVGGFVLDEAARIRDFRVRITRTQMVDLETLLLGELSQSRQRGRHFAGNGNRLAPQRGHDQITQWASFLL